MKKEKIDKTTSEKTKKINFNDKKNIIIISLVCIIFIIAIILINNNGKINIFEAKVNIKSSESETIKLVDYDHQNFKMKIPKGWEVSTAGDDMYFAIRVFNPNDDRYQIFSVLKAEPLLKNQKAKNWYENYYNLFGGSGNKLLARAIVLPEATVDSFYTNFNNYIDYVKMMGSTFNAPDLNNFKTIESFENNSQLKNISADDKILRGTFQDTKTGKNGEGLFMATIINPGSNTMLGYDVMFYTAYNVMGISAGEYDFVNYEKILTESLNSLEYKESFINNTIRNIETETDRALAINASIQQAFDSYNNAWTNRQTTYDITSQKYSDATLGYERVYDIETGKIYKAYNGFLDDYSGKRYQTVTDDMYTKSISGYIEK